MFCESLREQAMKIINFQKKKMKSLTKEQQESYENAKIYNICKDKFENKYLKDQKYCTVRDHCPCKGEYRGASHSLCNSKYNLPKKVPIPSHNGSNYDYHFIIKELAEEFITQLACLGENTEKYITFTVPIEKEVKRIDRNEEEIISRFMASSLSNLVNNLSEGIHRINTEMMIKNVKLVELNISIATVFLSTKTLEII